MSVPRSQAVTGAYSISDYETQAAIAALHTETGRLMDPHTAVGEAAAFRVWANGEGPVVVLSTAHPAKFPDAVRQATGQIPALPPRLSGLLEARKNSTSWPPIWAWSDPI